MVTEDTQESDSPKKKPGMKSVSPEFSQFLESLEKLSSVEEKLSATIECMRHALSDPSGPRLKDFWDAKHLCMTLFKESLPPPVRSRFWTEYTELNLEAKRLKEILDEQTAFSVEQIELAVEALEKDIAHYDELIKQIPHLEFPKNSHQLIKKEEVYQSHQRELHFLKTLVTRLDALRKEAIQTDMRISVKNKLLKRLAKLGDQVFPKRKELIKMISDQFILDVEDFAKERFPGENSKKPVLPYLLRNEIKSFQSLAKMLTLNTQSFTKTRKILSECWEKVKETESERKKEFEGRAAEFQKNKEQLAPKLQELETFCTSNDQLDKSKVLKKISTFESEMKTLPLSRDDVKTFRSQVQKIRKEAFEKIEAKFLAHQKKAEEKVQNIKKELETLHDVANKTTPEALIEEKQKLEDACLKLALSKEEKQVFHDLFLNLQSVILDKKEENAQSIDELEQVYIERKEHMESIKRQVEEYRKEMGGSGLDFEKAMTYRELYDSAKLHLDKEVEAVEQLEEKLIEKDS